MSIKPTRLVVALILALLLPLQGLAAVSAGLCMSLGHHDAGASVEHGHAAGEHHGGERHGGEQHGDRHAHDGDHPLPAQGDDSGEAHCAPCVACCAAASIAPAPPQLLSESIPAVAFATVFFQPSGFLPDELDRPPLAL